MFFGIPFKSKAPAQSQDSLQKYWEEIKQFVDATIEYHNELVVKFGNKFADIERLKQKWHNQQISHKEFKQELMDESYKLFDAYDDILVLQEVYGRLGSVTKLINEMSPLIPYEGDDAHEREMSLHSIMMEIKTQIDIECEQNKEQKSFDLGDKSQELIQKLGIALLRNKMEMKTACTCDVFFDGKNKSECKCGHEERTMEF